MTDSSHAAPGRDDSAGPVRDGSAAADRAEPRALRTRERVMAAFESLLDEKSLDEISVAELCREAGVHRVTFYGHWADLQALASDAITELVDRFADVPAGAGDSEREPTAIADEYAEALRRILTEIVRRREVYRELLVSSPGRSGSRLVAVIERRAELVIDRLRARGVAVPDSRGYAAAYVAGGTVAALARWAQSDDTDVDTVVASTMAQLPVWWPR